MVLKLGLLRSSSHLLSKGSLGVFSCQGSYHRIQGGCIVPLKNYFFTMASNADGERLKAQAEKAEAMISSLQEQINKIRKAAVKQAGLGEEEKLQKENEVLRKEIQSLNTALVIAEINNGMRQIHVPSKAAACATVAASIESSTQSTNSNENAQQPSANDSKVQNETDSKKSKKEEPGVGGKKAKTEPKAKKDDGDARNTKKAAAGDGGTADTNIDISRLDMRVGKIVAVERHPKADKLYVEKVDLGEGKNRTIVSGLVEHVPINAMKDRIAVFMCNLKPVKMREIFSEGMIMCASSAGKTEILVPPPDAEIGDRIIFEDYPGTPDVQMNPKKKIWETLKPDVRTDKDRVATYKGCPFTIKGKGVVVAPTLADAQIS